MLGCISSYNTPISPRNMYCNGTEGLALHGKIYRSRGRHEEELFLYWWGVTAVLSNFQVSKLDTFVYQAIYVRYLVL